MPTRVPKRYMEDSDPIANAIAPPQNESPEDREVRIQKERAAKQVSDAIDAELSREQAHEKKRPKPVKILLLGQSESGKSTTLKNFQLLYEPKAFRAERASWRAIIQLNVVRSIHVILNAIARAQNTHDRPPSARSSISSHDSLRLDAELVSLRTRLIPLLEIENNLMKQLSLPGSTESEPTERPLTTTPKKRQSREIAVNSTVAWKGAFTRSTGRESFDTDHLVDWDDPEDPGVLLHARSEDMKRLWEHPTVQAILEKQSIRLQELAGFFLDSLDEVTSLRYVPTDDHILRARLKTLGVSEHRMRLTDPTGGMSRDFRIFDVGGTRSLRAAWVSYFDDMDAIIFLAPISAFDQVLAEEPSVNRLADSFKLWTSIVSNKLLQHTNMILFLNKVDIMHAKLASGIRLSDFVDSYGRRPNDFDSASRYLRKQFNSILKQNSPVPRIFYCHLTNAIDTKSTKYVLAGSSCPLTSFPPTCCMTNYDTVKDMLMRFHLQESHLIL
ncbi:guanine nucleotide binding protein, alpha subunit [Mycena vulgaris]|nr:guanine nucleotide binding protein, alpha subunit [Mycena vulgaris]